MLFLFVIKLYLTTLADSALGQIRGRHCHPQRAALDHLVEVGPCLPRGMSHEAVAVFQLNPETAVADHIYDAAFGFNAAGSRHVKISGAPSVTSTVCS